MLSAGQLVHTATLERYAGDSSAGAAYDAPVTVPGYFEGGAQLLQDPIDREAGAVGTFYTNETGLPVGSRLSVQGVTGYVGEVLQLNDGWGLDHIVVTLTSKPRLAEYRTATVTLSKPVSTEAEWSDEAEATVPASGGVYASSVRARITSQITRTASDSVDSAEETLSIPPYLVTVDHEVNAYEGDHVLVTACPDDASLVNRTLLVEQVVRGTGRLERDLFCSLIDAVRPA